MGEQAYIVAGAAIYCDCGSHFRKLDLPMSHGSYIRDRAMVNETDCKPGENIPVFGVCLSGENENEEVQTSQAEGMLPFEGAQMPLEGRRCVPKLGEKWMNAKKETLVNGKPALTTECTLACVYGGVIGFYDDGQGTGK